MALDSKSGSRKINQHVDLAPGARNLTTTGNITAGAFYGDGSNLTGVITDTANDALITITAGGGLTGGGGFTVDQAVDAIITVSHSDTSAQASVANTAFNVIQSITLDTYGHITAIESQDIGTAGFYVKTTGETGAGVKIGLGSLTYQTVQFFAGTGLSVVRTDNEIQFSAPNATQWNTAYTYSQVGHLPLAGGTLTGDLIIQKSAGGILRLGNGDGSNDTNQLIGRIEFYNQDASTYGPNVSAVIEAQAASALGANSNILFKTKQPSTEGADALTSMTLDSSANLSVVGNVTGANLNVSNWDTAFSWGNHAGLYSLLGHTHDYLPIGGKAADSELIDGFDSTALYRQVYANYIEDTPESRWYVITLPYYATSGWSNYFYFDVIGYRDKANLQSPLHYRVYLHSRGISTSNNQLYADVITELEQPVEFFEFGYKSGVTTSNQFYIKIPEDYSGISIVAYPSRDALTASMIASQDTAPTGFTAVTPTKYAKDTIDLQDVTSNGNTTNNSITALSFVKSGGTSSEFLKADGSVDSSSYLTTSGKAADSELLDGINSTQFLRSDADDTASGIYTFTGKLKLTQTDSTMGGATVANASILVGSATTGIGIDNNEIHSTGVLYIGTNTGNLVLRPGGSVVDAAGNRFLTTADEGSGNGLDADLLDGNHASAFALASHTHSATDITSGTLADARLSGTYSGITLQTNGGNTHFTTPNSGSSSTNDRTVFGLAQYKNDSSTTTGAIVFYAPNTNSTIMHRLRIEGMLYSGGPTVMCVVQGYRTTGAWVQISKVNLGITDVQVRFAVDAAGKNCVILGDVNTVWSYPMMAITHAMFSHGGVTDAYCKDWTVGLVTSLTGFTQLTAFIENTAINNSIIGNAGTATKLLLPKNFTIGDTAKAFDGSAAVSWTLAEIGALGATSKAADSNLLDGIDSASFLRSDADDYTTGKLGIGATSPAAKLHVQHTSEEVIRVESGATGAIHFFNGTTRTGILGYSDGTSIATAADADDMVLRSETGHKLHLSISSVVGATLTSTGFGIGTTSPSRPLEVNGSAYIAGEFLASTNGLVRINQYDNGLNGAGEITLWGASGTGWNVGDGLGQIRFYTNDGSGIGARDVAKIEAVSEDGNGTTTTTPSGALAFYTSGYNANVVENMRLSSTGNLSVVGTINAPVFLLGQNKIDGSSDNLKISSDYNNVSGSSTIEFLIDGSEKARIDNSGNIGVGTTSPEGLLHISSSTSGDAIVIIEADTDNDTEGDIPQLWFRADGGINESAIINNDNRLEFVNNVASGGGIAFLTGATNNYGLTAPATGASVKMLIETGGNVGIGTTSPATHLHVSSGIHTKLRVSTTGVADASVEIHGYDAGVHIGDPTNGNRWAIWNDGVSTSSSLKIGSYALGNWYDDSSQVITITSTGNVGIGTTSPYGRLELFGNGNSWSTAPAIRMWDSLNQKGWLVGNVNNVTAGDFYIRTLPSVSGSPSSSDGITIKHATGFVGIGTTSPRTPLDVTGNGISFGYSSADASERDWLISTNYSAYGDFHIRQSNAKDGNPYSAGTTRFMINPSGNVGIGTTNIGTEANLHLGAKSTTEGGQLVLQKATSYTYDAHIDAWQDSLRILKGTDGTGSAAVVARFDLSNNSFTSYGDILPAVDNTGVIGNTDYTWADGQFTNLSVNSTLTVVSTLNVRAAIDLADSDVLRFGSSDDAYFVYNGTSNFFELQLEAAATDFRITDNGTTRFTFAKSTGNFTATGDVLAYSDARVKENVETIDNALDKVMSMRGVSYNRTDNDDKAKKVGVIAQEIQKVLPEVVSEQEDGMLSVSYGNIVGVLIEAIKEQQKQIDELKSLLNGSTK